MSQGQKISQYGADQSPVTTDYVLGNKASGPSTATFKLSDLISLFFGNIPNNTIKSPALALSNALDGANGVQSQSNSGSAGGTIYYINLGGIKLAWGITDAYSISSSGGASSSLIVTLPTSFFNSIQSSPISLSALIGDARQIAYHSSAPTTTQLTLSAYYLSSGVTVGGKVYYLVIGT